MRFFLTALLGIAATMVRAACQNGGARQAWPSEQYEDQQESNENGSSCADHVSISPYHRHANSQKHRFSFHRFRFASGVGCAISHIGILVWDWQFCLSVNVYPSQPQCVHHD